MPVFQSKFESLNRYADEAAANNRPNQLPFKTSKYFYKYAAFGTGLALSDDGTTYSLGGPGAWSFSGSAVAVDVVNGESQYWKTPDCAEIAEKRGAGNRKCADQDLSYSSYLGFKQRITDNLPNFQNKKIYVNSAPNSDNTGEIIFYMKDLNSINKCEMVADQCQGNLKIIGRIKGKEVFKLKNNKFNIGTSFGFDFIFADLNGDGLDDIIISAPQYFKNERGGAIVIILSKPGHNLWGDHIYEEGYIKKIHKGVDSYFQGW